MVRHFWGEGIADGAIASQDDCIGHGGHEQEEKQPCAKISTPLMSFRRHGATNPAAALNNVSLFP